MVVQLGAKPQHRFDEPLGLLSDCHRRIEHFLGVLQKIAEENADSPLSDERRQAAETALTYFRVAGSRHNEDEEESLFPLLRDCAPSRLRNAIEAIELLETDHHSAASAHQEIESLYRRWIDSGRLSQSEKERLTHLLEELATMYRHHIDIEDKNIFPLAAAMLRPEQLARVGHEMAERRGIDIAQHSYTLSKGDIPVTTKHTIDVRTIPGPQRHPLIFQTFEALQPGEALELVNDHDPFPLRNQFNMMKRGQFNWDYLQQGPELWRVRIAKVEKNQASS